MRRTHRALLVVTSLAPACAPSSSANDAPERDAAAGRPTSDPPDGASSKDAATDVSHDAGPHPRACRESMAWQPSWATPPGPRDTERPLDCGASGTLLRQGGPPENRIDFVILGDGYRADELSTTYAENVERFVAHMFSEEGEPYRSYQKYFNVCRLDVASRESGVDIPDEGVTVDTAFDGEGSDSTRLGLIDADKVRSAVAERLTGTRVVPDWLAVALHTDRWFNSGGAIMVWAGARPGKPDVALHEAGHSFHGLADEYGGDDEPYRGAEPGEPNVSIDATGARWAAWLGYDQPGVGVIGAYEGARYHDRGIYRPSQNSKMNQVPALHNAPCMEKIVLDLYARVQPLDGWTENGSELEDPCALEVAPVDAERVQVTFEVDGTPLGAHGPRLDVASLDLTPGVHTIVARASDLTPLVRGERPGLTQEVRWTVRISAPP